jgi:hypothetical protein
MKIARQLSADSSARQICRSFSVPQWASASPNTNSNNHTTISIFVKSSSKMFFVFLCLSAIPFVREFWGKDADRRKAVGTWKMGLQISGAERKSREMSPLIFSKKPSGIPQFK